MNLSSNSIFSSDIKYSIIRVILGIALMFISAQVQIPLQPIPITLHTVGTLIIALTYKRNEALTTFGSYLTIGAIGAPMFSGFIGGIDVLMGMKGGYYFGMLFCIYLITTMRKKFGESSLLHLTIYSLVGTFIIYAIGVPWLAHFIGIEKAIMLGGVPFIFTGALKALFTASTIRIISARSYK